MIAGRGRQRIRPPRRVSLTDVDLSLPARPSYLALMTYLSPALHMPNTHTNTLPHQGLVGDDVDFENTWSTISAAFTEIHTKNASRLSYEELYRHAYRVVLKKKGEELYKRVRGFEHSWLSTEVRSVIQGLFSPNLLANSQNLGGTTANERRVAGEKFLKGLKQAWTDHQVCMSMLADVLMYMVRIHFSVPISFWKELRLTLHVARIVSTVRTTGVRRYIPPPCFSSATTSLTAPLPTPREGSF